MSESDDSLINFVLQASDTFKFLAYVLSNERVSAIERLCGFNRVPVTQDASASAYQIMSYLLLNASMGRLTNLLSSPDNEIQDLYSRLRDELKKFLPVIYDYDYKKYAIIESHLTRKIIRI